MGRRGSAVHQVIGAAGHVQGNLPAVGMPEDVVSGTPGSRNFHRRGRGVEVVQEVFIGAYVAAASRAGPVAAIVEERGRWPGRAGLRSCPRGCRSRANARPARARSRACRGAGSPRCEPGLEVGAVGRSQGEILPMRAFHLQSASTTTSSAGRRSFRRPAGSPTRRLGRHLGQGQRTACKESANSFPEPSGSPAAYRPRGDPALRSNRAGPDPDRTACPAGPTETGPSRPSPREGSGMWWTIEFETTASNDPSG